MYHNIKGRSISTFLFFEFKCKSGNENRNSLK